MIRHQPQCQFSQGGEIGFFEEILGRASAVGEVDPAFAQPLHSCGRQIHEFKNRAVKAHAVGHGLANVRAGNLTDRIGAAFNVLDI